MNELLIGIGIGFFTFAVGLMAGSWITSRSIKQGIRIGDRLRNNLPPITEAEIDMSEDVADFTD